MSQPDVLAIDHMATSPYRDLPCYQMFGLESYLAASIEQSAATLQLWETQYRIMTPEGQWRWIEGKANPEKLPEGSVLWHGYIVDIDERRKNEEMKNQFVSTVSHELRTPLMSIAGSLGLILGGVTGDISEKTRKMLNITRRNADQLRALIDDLLDIDKLISGNMLLVMEHHSIAKVVSTAVEHIQTYANQKHVELRLKETSTDLEANIDPQRLQQAAANLLSNAVKFSPAHEDVTIEIRQAGDQAVIEVSDKGTGVPESFRNRIFEKFAQANGSSARAKEGTGLGLAITKQLMNAMGGEVGYVSEEGAGATFWLSIPIQGTANNE